MRLCVIAGTFHPEPGGPPTYLYHLLPALLERGFEVSVITYGEIHDPSAYPYPVTWLTRQTSIPLRLLTFIRAVFKQGRQADLLFVSDYGFPAAVANLFLRKPMAMKIVSDFAWEFCSRHGWTDLQVLDFQTARHTLRVQLVRAVERWYARQADRVIVPSQHVERLVRGWGVNPKNLHVIYNALPHNLNLTPPKHQARQALGWPPDAPILVTVGRVAEVKRVDVQLRALARLDQGHLYIIGDGPQRAEYEQLADQLGPTDRVTFTGTWSHDQALLAIRAADVFVLSSRTEGLSHVLLEAMQLGTPRVASDVGGNPELITNQVDGLLVPYKDVEALASALQDLLDNPARREELAQNALKRAENFSWETLIDKTEALLREVADAG
jgi:glycosyltransferase involved in cell wall biosynthesis